MAGLMLSLSGAALGQAETDKTKQAKQSTSSSETKSKAQAESRDDVPKSDESGMLYWIFLTSGKSTEGVDSDEIQNMQTEHLANFKRLADMGKLLTAGPMSDPENKLRGIVIVRAQNRDDLMEMFKSDPYVQQGYLKIEANPMRFEYGTVNTKITPQGLDEFRLIVIEKNGAEPNESQEKPSKVEEVVSAAADGKELLLGVSLADSKQDRCALLIMPKPEDEDAFSQQVQDLPGVKSGQFKTRTFPLYMGKGSLKPQATEPTG